MKRKIFFSLVIIVVPLILMGCNQKTWKEDNEKWYCYNSDQSVNTGWFKDKDYWYYADNDGVMKTGWIYDKGNWYYLYSTGQMAHDINIDEYYLGSSGAWTNNIPPKNASNGREVLYHKKVPLDVVDTSIDSYNTNNHSYTVSVKVKSDEYNLEKTFFLNGSNLGADPYASEILNGSIKKGDTVYAEMYSWKIGDTVTRRELEHLEY